MRYEKVVRERSESVHCVGRGSLVLVRFSACYLTFSYVLLQPHSSFKRAMCKCSGDGNRPFHAPPMEIIIFVCSRFSRFGPRSPHGYPPPSHHPLRSHIKRTAVQYTLYNIHLKHLFGLSFSLAKFSNFTALCTPRAHHWEPTEPPLSSLNHAATRSPASSPDSAAASSGEGRGRRKSPHTASLIWKSSESAAFV